MIYFDISPLKIGGEKLNFYDLNNSSGLDLNVSLIQNVVQLKSYLNTVETLKAYLTKFKNI